MKFTASQTSEAAEASRKWLLVNADGQILGRLATRIATVLRGKHKPAFTPHVDGGDFVVVINAEKIRVTGNKATQKLYSNYSGYPSGLKQQTFEQLQRRKPERIIEHAVKGMLPDGPLGRRMLTKLKVYKGPAHPHAAQQPQLTNLTA